MQTMSRIVFETSTDKVVSSIYICLIDPPELSTHLSPRQIVKLRCQVFLQHYFCNAQSSEFH